MATIRNRIFLITILKCSLFVNILETVALPQEFSYSAAILSPQNSDISPPTSLTIHKVNASFLELMWEKPRNRSSEDIILHYQIFYSNNNITHDYNTTSSLLNPKAIITGLEPFTLYDISVRAFDDYGNFSPLSSPVKQRTEISGPSAPTVIILTCEDDQTAKFKWHKPIYFNNTIDSYNVSIRAKLKE